MVGTSGRTSLAPYEAASAVFPKDWLCFTATEPEALEDGIEPAQAADGDLYRVRAIAAVTEHLELAGFLSEVVDRKQDGI